MGLKEDVRELVNCRKRGRDPENWEGKSGRQEGDGLLQPGLVYLL